MINLVLAALFLPLSHFLIASTPLRAVLVGRLGGRLYSISYSVLTLAAFGWLVVAYRGVPVHPLWVAPQWISVALSPVILAACVLVAAGLTTPNPVIVGCASLFARPHIVRGILRVTRNPFFWGASLVSAGHVIILGDVAAVLAFGTVALLGLAGAPILDAKKARRHGKAWSSFGSVTSSTPFLAIAQGRQTFVLHEIGLWRIALGAGLFLAALLLHYPLFGAV